MTSSGGGAPSTFRDLLGLDLKRLSSIVRYPTMASTASVLLPVIVVVSALWILGRMRTPTAAGPEGALTLGLLVAGSTAFVSHGMLFGGEDLRFLGRLGVTGRDLYLERGCRLLVAALVIAVALSIPSLVGGMEGGRSLAIALAAALTTAAISAMMYGWSARAIADPGVSRILGAGMGFDMELAKAAPLVYAPIPPFIAGAIVGVMAGTPGQSPWIVAALAALPVLPALRVGAGLFDAVSSRFLPAAAEMSFVPPPRDGGESFRVGRGLSGLLPAGAAAVWVRDAAVGGRRFTWAARVTWPVVGVSFVALARWGETPVARIWVLTVVGLALLVQAVAVIGMGRIEGSGRRWIDRSLGATTLDRFLGRWSWAWGLSLWLLVPTGLAWGWWADGGPLWHWPLAGAITALMATSASLLTAARR